MIPRLVLEALLKRGVDELAERPEWRQRITDACTAAFAEPGCLVKITDNITRTAAIANLLWSVLDCYLVKEASHGNRFVLMNGSEIELHVVDANGRKVLRLFARELREGWDSWGDEVPT